MRKGLVAGALIFFLGTGTAWADAATKLARGIHNIAFGWFELVNETGNEVDAHGVTIGLISGPIRGAAFTAIRMLAGVYEVTTFLLPNWKRGYGPIVEPELVFKRR